MKKLLLIFLITIMFYNVGDAQNTRLNDHNTIGWYNYFGTFKLNNKLGIHTEYQWRRDNVIINWQQSLLRFGLNYQLHPKAQLRLGYGWIETFAYGDIPLNSFGKNFTEHRLYEMITLNDKISIIDLSHRFMLEQRWLGRYTNATLDKEDEFAFANRLRYMFRMQLPLKGKNIENKTPYVTMYDEVFIGFGKNVNENIFDQNRIAVLLGYKFNKTFRAEAGFINQTVQLGREVNNRNVFQYNNGLIVNAIFNFDLSSSTVN